MPKIAHNFTPTFFRTPQGKRLNGIFLCSKKSCKNTASYLDHCRIQVRSEAPPCRTLIPTLSCILHSLSQDLHKPRTMKRNSAKASTKTTVLQFARDTTATTPRINFANFAKPPDTPRHGGGHTYFCLQRVQRRYALANVDV